MFNAIANPFSNTLFRTKGFVTAAFFFKVRVVRSIGVRVSARSVSGVFVLEASGFGARV